jgi:hypothetical protein
VGIREVNEEDGEVGEDLVRELEEPLDHTFDSRFGEERTSTARGQRRHWHGYHCITISSVPIVEICVMA